MGCLTSLFFQQVFLLVAAYLWRFDLRGQLRVDVVAVADVVHATAATRDDTLDLLSVIHLGRLVPVWIQREERKCYIYLDT
jgi:hypothetical protein